MYCIVIANFTSTQFHIGHRQSVISLFQSSKPIGYIQNMAVIFTVAIHVLYKQLDRLISGSFVHMGCQVSGQIQLHSSYDGRKKFQCGVSFYECLYFVRDDSFF